MQIEIQYIVQDKSEIFEAKKWFIKEDFFMIDLEYKRKRIIIPQNNIQRIEINWEV